MLFQDLSKAYDRVNLNMLELSLKRIKLPQNLVNFILSLFMKRTNRVIGHFGLTDPYQVLIGIDQGEVISPLLWTIYYDPLLKEINDRVNTIGYQISHSWRPDLSKSDITTIKCSIASQAYMDDTTWISNSKEHLESILTIADDFYTLNNIKVNKKKSVLFVYGNKEYDKINAPEVNLYFGNNHILIKPVHKSISITILGVWFNMNFSKSFVFNQAKEIIKKACKLMRYKHLTEHQALYIFNWVICPQVEYKTQLTVFTE